MVLSPTELQLVIDALERQADILRRQMKAPSARAHYRRIADIETLAKKVEAHYRRLIS